MTSTENGDAPKTDFDRAMAWLAGFTDYEQALPDGRRGPRFELDRMEALLDALHHPERRRGILHVAGSKGKGSVVLMLDRVGREHGARTGRFLSPHLEHVTERIAVGGHPLEEARFAHFARRLAPYVEACLRSDPTRLPTFFESITAMAHLAFQAADCDWISLEVGLGGRLDATNLVTPEVSIITPIDLEHTRVLGRDLESIAREKAGILKPGVPAVTAMDDTSAAGRVIAQIARDLDCPLWRLGREILVEGLQYGADGWRFQVRTPMMSFPDLLLATPGVHQTDNAAVALGALAQWAAHGGPAIRPALVARALRDLELPGRTEVFPPAAPRRATVLLDTAHTPDSFRRLAGCLERVFPDRKPDVVLGLLRDKDVESCLAPLRGRIGRLVVTEPPSPRALPAHALARRAQAALGVSSPPIPIPLDELAAWITSRPGGVVVAGSTYLAGELRPALRSRVDESSAGMVDSPHG
ncbi:MAG TPA: bifunctional folylpolyglutamate synthase/dihydrofolate synthase [Planctomycetes bacterium]|nr:bifunctional folylpolyglutamate synthase/dihydrofolate synthase [Planctomycetota bacterium]